MLALLVVAAPALAQSDGAVSAELKALADADQADRQANADGTMPWSAVAAADSMRLARVEALTGAGRLRTGADLYHAALVFQHDVTPYSLYRAYTLSRRAYEEDGNEDARWLVPRAYDRWQQSIGRPQVYGTQAFGSPRDTTDHDSRDNSGAELVWSLGNEDLDAVSDEERARWGIHPAAAVREMIECLNTTGDFERCDAAWKGE